MRHGIKSMMGSEWSSTLFKELMKRKCPDCNSYQIIKIDPPILTTNSKTLKKHMKESKDYNCYSCQDCGHLWIIEKNN